MRLILTLAMVAACLFASAAMVSAAPTCRLEKMRASGEKRQDIEEATATAHAALKAAIRKRLGKAWTPGSRRGAEYTCVKALGGNPKAIGWQCTLAAYACRMRPS